MAIWLVDENRPQEALKWGRKAAQSGSCSGLHGLAVALEANGRTEQALDIYRKIAKRYPFSGANGLIGFMLKHKYPEQIVIKEIQNLLALYEPRKDEVAVLVAKGFRVSGEHLSLLKQLFESDLKFVEPEHKLSELLLSSMYSRRFDKTVEYSTKLEKLRPLKTFEIFMTHAAMRLSGQTEVLEKIENKLRKYPPDNWLGAHTQYLLGKLTAEQLVEKCQSELDKAYAYWLMGIDAECEKDPAAACQIYQKAGNTDTDYMPRRLGQYWPEMIKAEPKANK